MSLTSCTRCVWRCRVGRTRGRSEHTSARLLGMVARAPRFTRGASGGELCAAYSHLRAVGWGLVDPELGLSIRFHSMGENFHTGRFSRPLCDCTGTARRGRRPPNFRALPSLLSAPSPICLSLTNFTHPPQPIRLSRPPLARIQRLSAGARLTGARNARNSAKAHLLVAPGTSARRLASGHRPPQATHASASRR